MAQNAENTFPKWLHYFDTINSTNNYAMQRIDDGLAQHGEVIWAARQTQGKGQRGNTWQDEGGNIAMSLIIRPETGADQQFRLSMSVALTLSKYLEALSDAWQVAIKWPNDIYINDKKTCGVLIENVFRGMNWAYAVIGIGINVNQPAFPEHLPHATSLSLAAGRQFDLYEIVTDVRTGMLNALRPGTAPETGELLQQYNNHLFGRNREMHFQEKQNQRDFTAFVQEVNADGQLVLLGHQGIEKYNFGELSWIL